MDSTSEYKKPLIANGAFPHEEASVPSRHLEGRVKINDSPLHAKLMAMVEQAADKHRMPIPEVYIDSSKKDMGVCRNNESFHAVHVLWVSSELAQAVRENKISEAGFVAGVEHELGHIKHYNPVEAYIRVRVALAAVTLEQEQKSLPPESLKAQAMQIVTYALRRALQWQKHQREYAADAFVTNPEALIEGLREAYQLMGIDADQVEATRVHPGFADRVARLRDQTQKKER